MNRWQPQGVEFVAAQPDACLAIIVEALGSTPRNAGAWMLINASQTLGTIGGGHLEQAVIQHARQLTQPDEQGYNLGTAMNQCCGGWVRVEFWPSVPADADQHRLPSGRDWPQEVPDLALRVYGAGHVGRALAGQVASLPIELEIVDGREAYLDYPWPAGVRAGHQASDAIPDAVLVMTHSHALDLEICQAHLAEPPWFIGLLGSRSKSVKFANQLRRLGLDPSPLVCPIGDKTLGKTPPLVALSILHHLMALHVSRFQEPE